MFNFSKMKQNRLAKFVYKEKIYNDFGRIYLFSNENLKRFNSIYNFDGARVLSVVGSGDQYFTCILNSQKEVELFDINKAAWDYFQIKFYAMQILSYEEFLDYFYKFRINKVFSTEDKIKELKVYSKLIKHLHNELHDRSIEYTRCYFITLDSRFVLGRAKTNIDYLSSENYYKLQQILANFFVFRVIVFNILYSYKLIVNCVNIFVLKC